MEKLKVGFSSFGFIGKNPSAVSIARKSPRGFSGDSVIEFAPKWSTIQEYRKTGDGVKFLSDYYDQIHDIPADQMDDILDRINGKILCCYCTGNDLCHRYLLAKALEYNFNAEVVSIGGVWPTSLFSEPFEKIDTLFTWPDGLDHRDYFYLHQQYKGRYTKPDYTPSVKALVTDWTS